jgi:hypothetical protein
MKRLILSFCVLVIHTAYAQESSNLISTMLTAKDTLFVKVEHIAGCKYSTQNEVSVFFDASKVSVFLLDSFVLRLFPKEYLSKRKLRTANRVLNKYKLGHKLSRRDKKYLSLKINDANGLFDYSAEYLIKDSFYLKSNFELIRKKIIEFEKKIKEKVDNIKNEMNKDNNRSKITIYINDSRKVIVYYVQGCENVTEYFKKYFFID